MLSVLSRGLAPLRVLEVPRPNAGGVPFRIVVDGVVYDRIRFDGVFLDTEISSQPLYMRPAS